ncbi:ubiquitin carboxyl-terminal hydrolase 47-like isoform X1 [Bombus flavifrons]|uniref:ubiquitin carboxyl-terminal hydrolase 47-like isoform X1 n=2 Tax=Bombus flavifrons TaxID=103934 RepID=UPI003704536E
MVCRAGQICFIQCNLPGVKNKIFTTDRLLLHESTRGEDLYVYIGEQCQIQPDSFKLYLVSGGKLIDLSEKKDKTMSEIGVDFSFDRESSTEHKHTLVVMDPADILMQKQFRQQTAYNAYNPPPPSPNHSSVWGEDNNVDFKSLIKSETSYVGLVNQAMTCYLNSLLQALYMTPEFRNALYNWEYVEGSEKDEANSIPYQLQKLFLNLQTSTKSAVETTALTKSFGWDSTEAWQQHDIQELCRVMFDALEQKFKNTEQADLINRLYEGKMIDYVKCLECGTEKSREDTFLDIPLPVRPFGSNVAYTSVEEALRAFVQHEILEGSNQYHCEKCNKKCDAHKGLKFTKFPYLLTLHLKRFDFDFKTFHRIKLNDKVTFPDTLNLNSFIASMPNQESPSTDENISLAKCDDNSITDSGTLDDDCPPCENSLPNSNHSTNHDQDDDEGIDMSNGPSTSNCAVHNHENEKNRSSNAAKGPYNYELFSIMIHSGSASGGHYYAYIKDFRTNEWFCFNDQSVTQITHDDIQKTYGGGSTRSYFTGAYSSTNAYMLMYRQIDSARNALPIQVQDFPKHIQELLKKMKENEDNDRESREKDLATPKVKVYCQHPTEDKKLNFRLSFSPNVTWAQTTKIVYKNFCLEGMVSLNQCRLVVYDHNNELIVASYEGREHETFASIWGNRVNRYSLLLEIRDKDQKFEPHLRGGIVTKVYVVDVSRKKLIEGPLNVRGLFTQTVREYKQVVGKFINMDPSDMKIVLRKHGTDAILVQNDDAILAVADFCNLIKVFVCTNADAECNKSYFETTICGIAEQLENIITLRIKLPPNSSKEILEELNIPMLDEVNKDKEKPVTDSPSKVSVPEPHRDASTKCNETSKSGKLVEDTSVRNASPQLVEGEEWHTPEQSNSEDSSLSDSDKTLVGDAPGDEDFQLPYLPSSTSNRAIKMLNQVGLENWDNIIDDSEYYFKATPYTNHNEKFLKVLVDKRMIFNTLKKNLEPYVGVPAEYFKICRYFDECGESECSCLLSQLVSYEDGEKLWIEIGRALRNGEFTVKLHQFFLDSAKSKFLFEWIVSEDMTVGQAKKEILAEMKRRYNIEIPYERCRLREKCFVLPSKVLLDHQKFKDFQYYSQFEMIVQELPDKDPVTNSNQVIVFVRRWYPIKFHIGPPQEIVLDETTLKEMMKKLSLISDIPEEYINIIRGKGSVHMPIVRIENEEDWIGLTTLVEFNVEDGAVFLYRDSRETSHPLTQEEYDEIAIREVSPSLPLSSASRCNARKEKALRIYLDGE